MKAQRKCQCAVFQQVVQILSHYGVEYKDINVLEDPMIRVKLSEQSGGLPYRNSL